MPEQRSPYETMLGTGADTSPDQQRSPYENQNFDPGIDVFFPGDPGYVEPADDFGSSSDRAFWPRDQAEIDSYAPGTWYQDFDGITKRKGSMIDAALSRGAAFLGEVTQMIPFADEIAAGGNALLDMAQAGIGGGQVPSFGDAYQNVRARNQQMSQNFNRDAPNVAALARGVGLVAPLLVPGGQAGAAQQGLRGSMGAFAPALRPMSRMENIGRGAALGSASTALTAAGEGDGGVSERLQQATGFQGALNPLGVGLGALAGRLTPVAPSQSRNQISPDVVALAREGVQMTPGQVQGGMANRFEQSMTSVPFLGDSINRARRDSIEGFNRAIANRSLRNMGEQLPADIAPGRSAVNYMQGRMSAEYDRILPQMTLVPDQQLIDDVAQIGQIADTMTPQARAQLENILGSRVTSRIANRQEFSGPELQRVLSELNTVQGRFSASPDADQRAISQALGIARDAMRSAAGRQNTQLGQELGGVNRAYGELADYENAMNRAGVSEMGATPRQIEAAMRQGDRTVRRRATAAGNARNQDFVQAGVNVLPQTVPDSGTAGRALTGLGVGGGAYMVDPTIAITGAATTGVGMAAYSRPAIELYNRALNRSISEQERRFAAERLGVLAMQDPNLAPLIRSLRDATAISGGIASGQ